MSIWRRCTCRVWRLGGMMSTADYCCFRQRATTTYLCMARFSTGIRLEVCWPEHGDSSLPHALLQADEGSRVSGTVPVSWMSCTAISRHPVLSTNGWSGMEQRVKSTEHFQYVLLSCFSISKKPGPKLAALSMSEVDHQVATARSANSSLERAGPFPKCQDLPTVGGLIID